MRLAIFLGLLFIADRIKQTQYEVKEGRFILVLGAIFAIMDFIEFINQNF